MNPLRYGSYAFMMISHKLVRWLLFPSLLGWLIGPLLLVRTAPWTLLVAVGMLVGLVVARLVLTWPDDRRLPRVVALPGYVFISIVAGWMAWVHLLRQEKSAVWEPTQRPVVDIATPT
jgi:uncharacterized membrane protein YfcA